MYNIACCFEKISKFENAIRWFRHGLEVQPQNSDILYGLALTHFKTKRYQEATEYIEQAIEKHSP